jgi:hypothetical protein
MAAINMIPEEQAAGRVKEIYEDIKAQLGIDFVPNLYKVMAAKPGCDDACDGPLGSRCSRDADHGVAGRIPARSSETPLRTRRNHARAIRTDETHVGRVGCELGKRTRTPLAKGAMK